MNKLSLRWQISCFMAILLLASLLLTGWWAFRNSREVVQDLTLEKMKARTDRAVGQLNHVLENSRADLLNTIEFPPIPGLIRCWDNAENPGEDPEQPGSDTDLWIERLSKILSTEMKFHPVRQSCAVFDGTGAGILRVTAVNDQYVVDLNRLPSLSPEIALATEALKPDEIHFSPMVKQGNQVFVHCAAPFFDKDEGGNPREKRGVLLFTLNGKTILEELVESLQVGIGDEGTVDVVDETMQFLFSNETGKTPVPFGEDRYDNFKPVRANLLRTRIGQGNYDSKLNEYSDLIPASDTINGIPLIGAYRRVFYNHPEDRSRFWVIAPSERVETALAPVTNLKMQFLGVGFAVLLGGGLLSYFAARRLTSSLRALALSADDIARGNLEASLPETASIGEIGVLAGSLQSMTRSLQDTIERITSQEARTKAIINSTVDAIITIDEHGRILSCNEATERMFGYATDQLVGKKASILARELYEEDTEYDAREIETGEMHIIGSEIEVDGNRRDRSTFPIAMRVAEMNHDGERLFIATIQDITHRQQAEAERQRISLAIRDAVQRLTSASSEILATTTQQATGAQEQASTVSELVSTAEEIAASAKQSVQRANEVADSARHSDEVGTAGQEAISDSIAAMHDVKQQVESLAENILSLAERAQTIKEITATVNDIAEQTNVLALNAAVEASRAGEHGKGFAVVAAEVKSLAEQSKKATSQVRSILSEIQNATNAAVLSTESGTRSASSANTIIGKAGETINALAATLAESVRTASQISASANQQAVGVGQLSEGVRNIDRVAKHNLQAIQQIEQSAQNLNGLSNELASLVGHG